MVEVKGSVIIETIEMIKRKFGEETYARIVNALDAGDREMFGRLLMEIGWYNLDSFARFLEQYLALVLNGDEKEIIARSEALFERQLKGVYRFFIKLSSAEFILKSLSSIHRSYFKGVTIDIRMSGPRTALVTYTGFTKTHRIIGLNIIGFYKKALEMSGAKEVDPQYTTPIEAGQGHCELSITWTGK